MKLQVPQFPRAAIALAAALLVAGAATAQSAAPAYQPAAAAQWRAPAGAALASTRGSTRAAAVQALLAQRGRDAATVAATREVGVRNGRDGMVHARYEQVADGLPVYGAYAKLAVKRNGDVVSFIDHLAKVPAAGLAPAAVDDLQALRGVVARLHPASTASLRRLGSSAEGASFDGGSYFHEAPTVAAVAVPLADGSLQRGWRVQTWSQRGNQLHETLVGGDGRLLHIEARTVNDEYNVFAVDPDKGPQAVVAGPGAGNAESPVGWLGMGGQTTVAISGNNVSAYLDADGNNRPDRGGAAVSNGSFVTAADLAQSPSAAGNPAVAVQNLFFLNNRVHDILYRHGFDEAAGNFQIDNFGKGGKGRDPVNAEAQDGSGTDNANFATPSDGRSPRMQMFLWTGPGATHEVAVAGGATYAALPAVFGPALSATGVSGTVAAASPADGCTAVAGNVSGKLALIDRGTCDFVTKVLNAQSAGATGVIMANNQGGTAIITMGGSSKRVRIASLMISQNDGAALRGLVDPGATLRQKAVLPLQKDGDLDSDIVYHEYGHGLTWRMIGGMSGPVAGAIGEGMSDGVSLLINGDDVVGEYAFSNPLGIRRFRYEGYPLTYGSVEGAEVHDGGEVYAAIVWDLMNRFGSARRDELFTYLVDGMNFTPATPAFEDMRDGVLSAVAAGPQPLDRCTVWAAYAKFGVGVGARATVANGAATIVESFAMPADCP